MLLPAQQKARAVSGNIKTTMTFDDFKKHFEVFSKIDTPEKLAICERQYKQHLLGIEDEKHFEPVDESSNNDTSNLYETNLKLTLGLENITDSQIAFLTMPSFEPESLLIIENRNSSFRLTYTTLESNYWQVFYADSKIASVDKTTLSAELNKEVGSKIFDLLYECILKAKSPESGRIVLDGVKYYLSCIIDEKIQTVSKHSPNETSKPARVIEVLEILTHNINALDDNIFNLITNKIDQIK